MRKAPVALLFVLLLAGCASAGSSPRLGRSDLIVQEQIQGKGFINAYDIVETLRSNWLQKRGEDSFSTPSQIQVYVDNVRLGGVANLRQIPAMSVTSIQWYNGVEASGRWGLGHGAGAIAVSTTPVR